MTRELMLSLILFKENGIFLDWYGRRKIETMLPAFAGTAVGVTQTAGEIFDTGIMPPLRGVIAFPAWGLDGAM